MASAGRAWRAFGSGSLLLAAGCVQILGIDGDFKQTSGGSGGGSSSSSSNGSASSSSTGGAGGAPTRTVTGTETLRYVRPLTVDTVSPDLSNVTVEILTYDGAVFHTQDTSGSLNGNFTIPNVPLGSYYLHIGDDFFGSVYFVSSEDHVDLTKYILGKSTAVDATVPTHLTLDVAGLAPWKVTDRIEFISGISGTAGFDLTKSNGATGLPANNATSLLMTIDVSKVISPHLMQGDASGIMQLEPQPPGVGTYEAITKFATLSPATLADGGSDTASGAFQAVTLDQQAKVSWKVQAFEGLASQVNPTATAVSDAFSVQVEAGDPVTYGLYGPSPDVLRYDSPVGVDQNTTLAFGNPFLAGWAPFDVVATTYAVPFTVPGATPTTATVIASYSDAHDAFQALTSVGPTITPPETPQIDGADFFAGGTLMSTSPTISWSKPFAGSPTSYLVRVFSLFESAGKTQGKLVGDVQTAGTSVTLPPGLVTGSQTYWAFFVFAKSDPGVLFEKTPGKEVLPEAQAPIVSGLWQTP